MSPVLKNCNITKRHRKLQSWNNLSLGILLCQTSGVQNTFVSCVQNWIQGLLWSGFKGDMEVGDLVLEETEIPLGDGGCAIVTDEAIPFILFFTYSITFNILVSTGAWELLTQSPLSRHAWHYTLFYFNDVIKKLIELILQKITIFAPSIKEQPYCYTDNSPILNLKPDIDKGNETPPN